MPSGQSRPPRGKFWPQHVTAWQTWKIGVSAGAVMEICRTPETVSRGQRGNNIIICFQPLPWPQRLKLPCSQDPTVHTPTHLDYIVRSVGLQWRRTGGRARVKTRAACTIVGSLHHSGPWLWQAWSWNAGRGMLGKVFCIRLMEYSPSSPVRLHSPDRQIHTHSHKHTLAHSQPSQAAHLTVGVTSINHFAHLSQKWNIMLQD